MGIRFLCPNGHKLNVKSFLAGKKGVCPHCDARFTIPLESDPRAAKKKRRGEMGNGAPAAAANGAMGAASGTNGSIDFSRPAAPQAAPVGKAITPAAVASVATAAVAKPSAPVTQAAVATPPAPIPASAPQITDPIAEAPNAIWYVRPPTGNQYGPARGDIMRKWIAEGRVSGDSLVWREGWADWQTANQVLPSMAASTSVAPSVASSSIAFGAATTAVAEVRISDGPTSLTTSRARGKTRTRPSNALAIGVVVTLALLAVGLLVALVMVIQHTSK